MPEVEVTKANTGIEPTAVQQARAASRQRFNWFFIYTPLIIFSLILLIITGLLIWGALSPNITGTRKFVSGVADIIIILTILPMTLLCLLPSVAVIGVIVYRRRSQEGEPEKYGRLQRLFWRIDNILDIVQAKITAVLPKVGQPVIRLNAILAFVTTMLNHLVSLFRR
ncbi:MAG: hypothetical protein H6658_00935 [Ardenticatenaceae bacterium]|nr:hypothetical protein [Ardenticatenaceae bacterium]